MSVGEPDYELSCRHIWFTFEHVIKLSTRLRCHSHLVCALEALAHILLSTGMNDQFPSKGRKSSTRRLGLGPTCNFYSWLFCHVYISFYILYLFLPPVFFKPWFNPQFLFGGFLSVHLSLCIFRVYLIKHILPPLLYEKLDKLNYNCNFQVWSCCICCCDSFNCFSISFVLYCSLNVAVFVLPLS